MPTREGEVLLKDTEESEEESGEKPPREKTG